jgi:uncharacterized membrane protein
LASSILALWPKYFSYALSFIVIGSFWMAHHRMFEIIERHDGRLVWLNILTLMLVSLIPFPTDVLGEHEAHRSSVILYAVIIGSTGLLTWLMWWYGTSGHRLVSPDLPPPFIRSFSLRLLVPTLIFFLSIGIAFVNPNVAQLSWFLVFPAAAVLRYRDSHGSHFDALFDA